MSCSDCVHLLNTGSPFHAALLNCLPPLLRAEWDEILRAHGSEATRILESTRNRLKGGSMARGHTTSRHQQLVPEFEQFVELTMRSYYSFEELKAMWARDIRNRNTGEAFLRLAGDPNIYDVMVKRSMPGHLQWDMDMLRREFPQAVEDVEKFIEGNFRSDFFTSPQHIDDEAKKRLEAIAYPAITQQSSVSLGIHQAPATATSREDPFL